MGAPDLDLFLRTTEELTSLRVVTGGGLSNLETKVSWERGGPPTFTSSEPDGEDFRSFLLTFRKFIARDSPVFVDRVANHLIREARGDEPKEKLIGVRQQYRDQRRSGLFKLTVDGDVINSSEVLDWWLNGHVFHDDTRKSKALEDLGMAAPAARASMIDLVLVTTGYICNVASWIVFARSRGLLD